MPRPGLRRAARWACLCALPLMALEGLLRLVPYRGAPHLYEEVADPELRWVHTPGFSGEVFGSHVQISPQGLRDKEYPVAKPAGTFRIVAVGECAAFGHSVPLEDAFVKQLERMLNGKGARKRLRFEVINAGVIQYDDLQKAASLSRFWLEFSPDLILFSHDIGGKPWIEARQKLRPFRLAARKIPASLLTARYLVDQWESNATARWTERLLSESIPELVKYRYTEAGLRELRTDAALRKLSGISRERKIPILVILLPWLGDLHEERYVFGWVHALYAAKCADHNLPLLDLYAAYFKDKDNRTFWVSGRNRRPNPRAHRAIAEQVLKELLRRKLLPV